MSGNPSKTKPAQLTYNQQAIELPVYQGTLGPEVIDVSGLHKQDIFTLDVGFMSTAACESKITFIDGDKGVLLYRGYPIDELAEQSDFMEVTFLLLHGELPTSSQRKAMEESIQAHAVILKETQQLFAAFPRDMHPMSMLLSAVGMLSGLYLDTAAKIQDPVNRFLSIHQLIAQVPVLAAMSYRHS